LVFHTELKDTCRRALDQFLSNTQPCAFLHSESGEKCVNTKTGHVKGHQSADGSFLAEGNFVNGAFDSDAFIEAISDTVSITLKTINENVDSNRQDRRQYAANEHRYLLKSLPDNSFWKTSFTPGWIKQFNERFDHILGARISERTSVCYACLFGRPEYTLPCGHVICFDCIREFDQSFESNRYPGVAIHTICVLCSSARQTHGIWPYTVEYQPDLSGVRVLSLDGGGVRGIIQLSVLQRLEQLVDLDIPFGDLFDLMVGTSAGGMIAIGLGIHNLSVEDCIAKFKVFCTKAFETKWLTKNPIFGWTARAFWASSIYKTEPLEDALTEMFGKKPFFGHHQNVSRVAVTTTVDEKCRLLANYNWGYGERYLNSNINTSLAARCTSAAPMYFDPALHDGNECRDGGLLENNPVRVAVNEARTVFGPNTVFDTVLSLGCGKAAKSQTKLSWPGPKWFESLYNTFIETMNGESAWVKFYQDASDMKMLSRCRRLNVKIPEEKEPELDDTTAVDKLEEWAKSASFHYSIPSHRFTPVIGTSGGEELNILADRLKASLYFFELRSLTRQDDVSIIKGWICCRLRASDRSSYRSLLEATSHFEVKGMEYKVPAFRPDERLRLEVSFQQQDLRDGDPIRIDVKFRSYYRVTISGFPVTLRVSALPNAHFNISLTSRTHRC
ncbi:FabD/lysophospholipase-like protein, partial [Lentithecium fluviatile CBS 122367]